MHSNAGSGGANSLGMAETVLDGSDSVPSSPTEMTLNEYVIFLGGLANTRAVHRNYKLDFSVR